MEHKGRPPVGLDTGSLHLVELVVVLEADGGNRRDGARLPHWGNDVCLTLSAPIIFAERENKRFNPFLSPGRGSAAAPVGRPGSVPGCRTGSGAGSRRRKGRDEKAFDKEDDEG